MPIRVAFDLDGTLADMEAALRREAHQLADGSDGGRERALDDPELWEHITNIGNFWGTLAETEPGVVARIADLVETRRWEIIFLTTRPFVLGETVQIQSQRWLKAQGFLLPSVFVVEGSRGRIADALHLDAVVDDRAENCLDVATQSKAKAILIWRTDPTLVPDAVKRANIRVAASAAEALDVLITQDSPAPRSGVVQSIKKFLNRG